MHRRIVEERDQGIAVLIVSSELDEIYALADRIAVMYEGKIVAFRRPAVPVEELGLLMAGAGSRERRRGGQHRVTARPGTGDGARADRPPRLVRLASPIRASRLRGHHERTDTGDGPDRQAARRG